MEDLNIEHLKFPIGHFVPPAVYSTELINQWISDIEILPSQIKQMVSGWSDAELNIVYRPGGWTARQVVHHIADSHINSFVRFKLALTEENPVIKPYYEDRWAEIADYTLPVSDSIQLLEGLHKRWVFMLKNMSEKDMNRTFFHPESKKTVELKENTGIYSWHGRHHLGHLAIVENIIGK